MSSFRRPKSEAALRLYNLPRRELQALCKQYGIPANKTNVAMADALSACIPVSFGKHLGGHFTFPCSVPELQVGFRRCYSILIEENTALHSLEVED